MRSALLIALVCWSLPALSVEKKHVDKAKEAEAKKLYDEATALYNLGQFPDAAERYKQAYTAMPLPPMLYNIAQSYRLANDFKNALFFYRSFLRAMPNTPSRKQVEERIVSLEAQLERNRALQSDPPTAPNPDATTPPTETPPPTAEAPAAASQAIVAAPADQPAATPVYKKWWLWTLVGVAVVGVGVGVGVGLGTAKSGPSTQLGTLSF
jgi:tetratricopeptide (TPR) repeat protein